MRLGSWKYLLCSLPYQPFFVLKASGAGNARGCAAVTVPTLGRSDGWFVPLSIAFVESLYTLLRYHVVKYHAVDFLLVGCGERAGQGGGGGRHYGVKVSGGDVHLVVIARAGVAHFHAAERGCGGGGEGEGFGRLLYLHEAAGGHVAGVDVAGGGGRAARAGELHEEDGAPVEYEGAERGGGRPGRGGGRCAVILAAHVVEQRAVAGEAVFGIFQGLAERADVGEVDERAAGGGDALLHHGNGGGWVDGVKADDLHAQGGGKDARCLVELLLALLGEQAVGGGGGGGVGGIGELGPGGHGGLNGVRQGGRLAGVDVYGGRRAANGGREGLNGLPAAAGEERAGGEGDNR